jgi:hypothetical protein
MVFMPRFEYGARTTRVDVLRAGLFATDRTDQVVTLASARPFMWSVEQNTATAVFELAKGDEQWLVLRYDDDDIHPVDRYDSAEKLGSTEAYWHEWAAHVQYHGPYRTMVKRSALVLKLLTHAETGAIIAAPTTSIPEAIGGSRNWDYRFVWLRDAAFTLAALAITPRPMPSCGSSRRCAATRPTATSRSCTGSTGGATWSSGSSIIWAAIRGPGPCGSATGPRGSSSWTCTARCWRPRTCGAATTR